MKFETNPLAKPSLLRGERTPIWGLVSTRFEDLDRNTFALVSFDEFSASLEAQRRALADKLEAERRAAQELEIATRVQARLFPQTLPPLASLEYAGLCVQARQVGGDYYDFLELGRGRLGLVIGDIAGKGIANPTALLFSALMMLRHIGEGKTASVIGKAVLRTLSQGEVLTGDFGGTATTTEFANEVIRQLGQ